jgi:hypothetical protein
MSLRPILACALVAATLATSGCGVIYSRQKFGSPLRGHSVSEGASRADVLANMGAPNAIYKSADSEAFIYKGVSGFNFIGLYGKATRTDTVVVMNGQGTVLGVTTVDLGNGWSIPSFPFKDLTHPVETDTLLFEPENYDYSAEQGGGAH